MPQHYKLTNPAISAVSIDGIEHRVNDDGLLEVHQESPNLARELRHVGAVPVDPASDAEHQQANQDELERQSLFIELDAMTGRRTDRRRSLPQLRELAAQYRSPAEAPPDEPEAA